MKNILVLSTRTSDSKVLLWTLSRKGYRNFAVGNFSKNKDVAFSPLCKKYYPIPEEYSFEHQSREIVSLIESFYKKEAIDLIMPSGFESVCFLARYKGLFEKSIAIMPVPDIKTIELLNNKWRFALFCQEKSIPHPASYLLEDIENVKRGNIPIKFPLLTKPLCMTASQGIYRFDSREKLLFYLTSLIQRDKSALPVILQEFIPGEDIDFNAFSSNGRLNAWTIQRGLFPLNKKDAGIRWLEFTDHPIVLAIGEQILRETCYSGPVHIDMRIDGRDGSVKTIECNPRFWASTIASLADGIDFAQVSIASVANNNIMFQPSCSKRLWGSFWKIPGLIFTKRDVRIARFLPRFTLIQIKYLLDNFIIDTISRIRRFIPAR